MAYSTAWRTRRLLKGAVNRNWNSRYAVDCDTATPKPEVLFTDGVRGGEDRHHVDRAGLERCDSRRTDSDLDEVDPAQVVGALVPVGRVGLQDQLRPGLIRDERERTGSDRVGARLW